MLDLETAVRILMEYVHKGSSGGVTSTQFTNDGHASGMLQRADQLGEGRNLNEVLGTITGRGLARLDGPREPGFALRITVKGLRYLGTFPQAALETLMREAVRRSASGTMPAYFSTVHDASNIVQDPVTGASPPIPILREAILEDGFGTIDPPEHDRYDPGFRVHVSRGAVDRFGPSSRASSS